MAKINVQEIIDKARMNRWFWMVYLVCIFVVIFDGYDMNIFGPVVPVLMQDMKLNPAQAGILASYALYGMLVGSFIFGAIADKIGQKKVIIISIIIYGVFTGLTGHAENQTQMAICRFIAGLGIAGLVPNVLSYVTDYTPKRERGALTTWVNIGLTFGGIAGTVLCILFLQSMGWRFMFYIAYIPVVMVLVFQLVLPEPMLTYHRKGNMDKIRDVLQKANPKYKPAADDEYVINVVKADKIPYTNLFRKGFARNTILIWVFYFMSFYLIFGMSTWLPNLMIAQGYALNNSLWLLLLFNLGTILGTTFGAWAAPKFGYKKLVITYYLIAAVLIVLLSINSSIIQQGTLLFFTGSVVLGGNAMVMSYVAQIHPGTFRSTALGCGLGIGRLGGAAGPLIGGFLLAAQAPMILNFGVFSIGAAVCAICILLSIDYTKKAMPDVEIQGVNRVAPQS